MAALSPEIVAFYAEGAEATRLSRGLGRLEFARMFESMPQDTSKWLTLVRMAGLVETEPVLSPHMLALAHKIP